MAWYRQGTISVTNGSQNVQGVGTQFTTQCKAGDILTVDEQRLYEIQSITDDLNLVLVEVYAGATAAGITYAIIPNFTNTTNADLAAKIAKLVNDRQTNVNEMIGWLSGTATGGPNSDGTYPITDFYGNTFYVKSAARFQQDVDNAVTEANNATSIANSAAAGADDALSRAQTAIDDANAAKATADSATAEAQQATTDANTATANANTATSNANTATTNANAATDAANTATTNANNATSAANTAATNAQNAADATNTAITNAQNATAAANTATTDANTARDSANAAASSANAAADAANTAKTNADTATANANTATTNANNATSAANTAATNAQNATDAANTAATNAQNAADATNTAITNAQNATAAANTATTDANTARDNANTAATSANNAAAAANTAKSNADTATANANTATTNANAATNSANTAATNAQNAADLANQAATNAQNQSFTTLSASTSVTSAEFDFAANAQYLYGYKADGTRTRLFGLNASNDLYIGGIDSPINSFQFGAAPAVFGSTVQLADATSNNHAVSLGQADGRYLGISATAVSANKVSMQDNRSVASAVGDYSKAAGWDFKTASIAGIGSTYAALLSVAPWTDQSGGNNHQLGFADAGGMFYRTGSYTGGYDAWDQVATHSWATATLAALNGNASQDFAMNTGVFYGAMRSQYGTPSWLTAGDIVATRSGGTQGYIGLTGDGSRYIGYDGSEYIMPGARLLVNGYQAWTAENFNPANYAALSGATYSGQIAAPSFKFTSSAAYLYADTNIALRCAVGGSNYSQDANGNLVAFHLADAQGSDQAVTLGQGDGRYAALNGSSGKDFAMNNGTFYNVLKSQFFTASEAAGDIAAVRSGGTTGVIFLDASGAHYLYWDGTNYNMPGGQLLISGSTAWHSGNFNPASKVDAPANGPGGVTRLWRRDGADAYSVQSSWDGSYWLLQGYLNDSYHAGARVALADTASNANALGGLALSGTGAPGANQVLRSDASGYVNVGWLNTVSGDMGAGTPNRIYCSNDQYLRYQTPSEFGAGITPYIGKVGSAGSADSATNATNSTKWAGANKTVSTSGPSGGVDGDIWLQREA